MVHPDGMRILVLALLMIVLGAFTLPLSALFLDGSDTGENLIIPVALVISCLIGAVLAVPVLEPEIPAGKRALIGVGLGMLGLVVGVVVFFLLLNGFDGA